MRDEDPNFVIDVSVPAASSSQIVSVGATKQDGNYLGIAPFSNINPTVCAPGVEILSTSLHGVNRILKRVHIAA